MPSHEKKLRILFLLLKLAIKTVMISHTNSWNQDIKLQKRGAGIGDKLAEAATRLFMTWWDNEFLRLTANAGIVISLFKRYQDDANIMTPPIRGNVKWDCINKCLIAGEEAQESTEAEDKKTFRILRQIANSVTPMLKW